ncbi:MAG: SH3 domain-containing protein [Ferruginibacter sp.]
MSVQDKYRSLTDQAKQLEINNLSVREQDNVLYIDGTAPNGAAKDALWQTYEGIDPNFAGGDLVMNVKVADNAGTTEAKVITESSNLNIRKGPGTDQEVVGKASHGETVNVVSKSNDQWWLVRTKDGEEGYCYARYLESV